jgi:hypothetical protein
LAKRFNLKEYEQPAGGCLLTDPEFAKRVRDLLAYQDLNLGNIELLKLGRHFRLSAKAKLVVGRDENENENLTRLAKRGDYLFGPIDSAGPTSLGRGVFDEELIKLSCSITCRYCDLDGKVRLDIAYNEASQKKAKIIKAEPLEEKRLLNLRI